MKNICLNIFLIIILLIFNGCSKQIMFATMKNASNWEINDYISGIDGRYKIYVLNKKDFNVIRIEIDRLIPNNKIENCKESFELIFEIVINNKKIYEMINYLKSHQITFDTSKVFIITNNKKYKVNLQGQTKATQALIDNGQLLLDSAYKYKSSLMGYDEILSLSNIFLQKIDKEKNSKDYISAIKTFYYSLQFGCQALEGATLVIDGIYLNEKELPPIEIKLSYKK